MKKFILGLVAIVMFSFVGNAQNNANRVKLFCITTSCCGIGPIGVEIWHETTCHYVAVHKTAKGDFNYSIKFETSKNLNEIEIKEDVLLAGYVDESGDNLVLEAGKYLVENNEMFFNPTTFRAKKYCYIREVSGNFLGHDYEYHIEICVSFGKSSNKGTVSIDPKLSKEQIAELQNGNSEVEFLRDVTIKDENVNYVINAGKYIVNEDGLIYMQNTNLR